MFERDPDVPADERAPAVAGTRAAALDIALRRAAPGRFADRIEARDEDTVVSVAENAAS